jgi:uncharacterized protein (DUF4415 family)
VQPAQKDEDMNKKLVRYTKATLPKSTPDDIARLEALALRPDGEIDLSDIPEMTEEDWSKAVRGKFYRPTKAQITAHIDRDVLAWLKAEGKGYQTRLNAILRREMLKASG